ncbi:MAG: thioredoxin family protein [Balneolaceae bacterium]|nr:thioredoxin family protein [Balneolaceae bacterium]
MDTIKQSSITSEIIDQAMDYEAFNKLTTELFDEGRTTNDDNSESMLNYTKLNIQRTHRIDKRGVISDETKAIIEEINTDQVWLVITEGWCGDSAQLLPYVKKMADLNDHIELKIIIRDKYPQVMDEFLTDGKSRSIPKVIILDKHTLEVLGSWGPRPAEVHQKYLAEKLDPEVGGTLASQNLHTFYARDKGAILQVEFRALLKSIT